nr:urokinase plasminogen activator surface receptor-like [Misgurnus anguillicaudatus]
MELKIFIVLLCTLFTGGHSLQCYKCSGIMGCGQSNVTMCPGTATCAATVQSTDGTGLKMQSRGCAVTENCISGSVNLGVTRTVTSTQCCNTDLCNNKDPPVYGSNSPNGKQCYYCDDPTSCLNKLNCLGDEDRCLTETGCPPTFVSRCISSSQPHPHLISHIKATDKGLSFYSPTDRPKMDLNIVIVLLVTFIAGGHSLRCYECTGATGSCEGVKTTCPNTANTCSASRLVSILNIHPSDGQSRATTGDNKANELTKKCDVKQNCVSGSMNFGVVRTMLSTQCCNTYLCNNRDVPDSSSNRPNGKQCYYCDGKSCSNRLNCLGDEDYCVTATLKSESTTLKGCSSKTFCDAVKSQGIQGFTDFSCCYGNLCNSITRNKAKIFVWNNAKILTQNVLLVLCSFFLYILIH